MPVFDGPGGARVMMRTGFRRGSSADRLRWANGRKREELQVEEGMLLP